MSKEQICGRLAPTLLTAMLHRTALSLTNTSSSTMTTSTIWWYIMVTFPGAPLAPAKPIHLKTHSLSSHVMIHRSKLLPSPECSTRLSSMPLQPVSLRCPKTRLSLTKDLPSLFMACKTETLARWSFRMMKQLCYGRWTAIWKRAKRQYPTSKSRSWRKRTHQAASSSERTALSKFTSLRRDKATLQVLLSPSLLSLPRTLRWSLGALLGMLRVLPAAKSSLLASQERSRVLSTGGRHANSALQPKTRQHWLTHR